MTSAYHFPPNANAERASIYDQIRKIYEEFCEVERAFLCDEGPSRLIEEAWDLRQAVEGLQRKFDPAEVEAGRLLVLDKCEARGDYPADVAEQYRPGTKWDPFLGPDEILQGLAELMEGNCDNCSALEICGKFPQTCEQTRARWLLGVL